MSRHASAYLKIVIAMAMTLLATSLSATSFIVPDDAEMVRKSEAIVGGVIVAANPVEGKTFIETEYELAVYRVLKGSIETQKRLVLRSPGGSTGERMTRVESAAHFAIGDHVLLFLIEHRGHWTPTDLTLGKFRFGVTNKGSAVVQRDASDIVGWDVDGKVHREKLRLENEFLGFIEEVVAGRQPRIRTEYEADPSEYVAEPAETPNDTDRKVRTDASKPSDTYAASFYDCSLNRYPGRWTTAQMNAGIQFKKNSAQNLTGAGDGGVATITNGLAAWTNDCNSAVNITYGGTDAAVRNGADSNNMVIFNDPNNDVPGSWNGSGTIAICFSSAGATHTFDGNSNWVGISSSDIVFQNLYTAAEASLNTAMTHEIGHGIGLRHADRHHIQNCTAPGCVISCSETACDPNVEECAATAIMTATANSGLGFTLQTYDQNAIGALYPGSCVALSAPTSVVAIATSGTAVQVSWTAAAGAAGYKVYRSTNNITFASVGTPATSPFTDSTAVANTAYMYKVTATQGVTESGFSNADLATTVVFTDSTLTANTTAIKALHFTQLRTAVNALRSLNAGQAAFSFTDAALNNTVQVKGAHMTELRTQLNTVRTALGFSTLSFTDTISTTIKVKKLHIDELRAGVQ